ncbi:hypothetical protein G6F43_005019 [Rhizopus delemar]|nr:hypothetical protein G6F43_005019 [Rhizopus delemar]
MQSLQRQAYDADNSSYQTVREFLQNCNLSQYYEKFIFEGFDSVASLLEITEEDMTVMNIKRGHRRLIQREIATAKGIPRDQPLATNTMGSKYPLESSSLKTYNSKPNYGNNNYEAFITGLASPHSMNSGLGLSNTNGNSSGNSSGPLSNNRFASPISNHDNNSYDCNDNSASSSNENVSMASTSNYNSMLCTSSNEDNGSVQSDTTAPKRKYHKRPKKDRNAPIKPMSAYIMFSSDIRTGLKDRKLPFEEVSKIIGDQWKALDEGERQAYERMAMRAKDEYLVALKEYKQTDKYRQYQSYLKDFELKRSSGDQLNEKIKRRANQVSPGSGSLGDRSINGNSTSNGSSGSSNDSGDKDTIPYNSLLRRRSQRPFAHQPVTNDYQDVEHYRQKQHQQQKQQTGHQPPEQYRSQQMLRGIIPVEFNETPLPTKNNHSLISTKHPLDSENVSETSNKKKSSRTHSFSNEQ